MQKENQKTKSGQIPLIAKKNIIKSKIQRDL